MKIHIFAIEIYNKFFMRSVLFIFSLFYSTITIAQNDVDTRILVNEDKDLNTFVLIISNENYKYEQPVPYALNDGRMFKVYCEKTLGIPSKNIHFSSDATLNEMRIQLMWLEKVLKAYNGEARAIVYYSGHGMPSENGNHAYLLPVDGNSQLAESGLATQKLYKQLGSLPSSGTIVMLDACFSGARRDGQMLSSSRGVAIKAKDVPVSGNMVVFTAAQGDETAYPYEEMRHGLFTFYILSALQNKGGCISLGELCDYVIKQVSRTSIVENGKSQTPSVTAPAGSLEWRKWMFARNTAKKIDNSINAPIDNKIKSNSATQNPRPSIARYNSVQSANQYHIGVFRGREIIEAMPEFSKAKKEIDNLTKQYEKEIQIMQDELQNKAETYEKEQAHLSTDTKFRREQELQEMYQKIQQTYQDNQQALNSFQKEKMEMIQSKVLNHIDRLGQQYNFLFVFDETISTNEMLVSNITELVKGQMGLGQNKPLSFSNVTIDKIGYVNSQEILSLMNTTGSSDSLQLARYVDRIKNALDIIALKHEFAFILDINGGIPYLSTKYLTDVTQLVKYQLNLGGSATIPYNYISNSKFGHVNAQEIIQAMPEFTKARADIEALTKTYETSVVRRSCRICTRRSSRPIRITSRLLLRSSLRRCRLSRPR